MEAKNFPFFQNKKKLKIHILLFFLFCNLVANYGHSKKHNFATTPFARKNPWLPYYYLHFFGLKKIRKKQPTSKSSEIETNYCQLSIPNFLYPTTETFSFLARKKNTVKKNWVWMNSIISIVDYEITYSYQIFLPEKLQKKPLYSIHVLPLQTLTWKISK